MCIIYFVCAFNKFPKCQLPSNFTVSQFITLALALESSAVVTILY